MGAAKRRRDLNMVPPHDGLSVRERMLQQGTPVYSDGTVRMEILRAQAAGATAFAAWVQGSSLERLRVGVDHEPKKQRRRR
jgi:hypothetical protein